MAGFHHHVDDQAGKRHTDKHQSKAGDLGNLLKTRRAVGKFKAQHRVNIGQHHADDLAKAQGNDGQIVTPQPQGRDTDDKAKEPRHHSGQYQSRNDVGQARQSIPGANQVAQRSCLHINTAGVSPHRHETGMAQRQLAQIAGSHIQGHRQNDVDADSHQNAGPVIGDDSLRNQGNEYTPQSYRQQNIDNIAQRHGDVDSICFHFPLPLTLFL